MKYVDATPGAPGLGFRITEILVAVAVHADGDEAVPAMLLPNGHWYPLIAADPERAEFIRSEAKKLSKFGNKSIKLVRFTVRTEIEVFHPDGSREDLGKQ